MNITTQLLADSINPRGVRLTSFLFTFPRIILPELNTHRVFSRNASSSRAIPIAKMIDRVRTDPMMPSYWGANKPGMQAAEELPLSRRSRAEATWRDAALSAAEWAAALADLGVHKQLANRPLEPFSRIQVIVTSRYWNNFFGRRAHGDAQPEFQVLSYRALERYIHSKPKLVPWGSWHLPFDGFDDPTYAGIHEADPEEAGILCAKVVTARCARTSYMNFHGKMDLKSDLELHDQLLASKHACYDSETEVLTNGGWVPWPEIRPDHKLAAYNTQTALVCFEKPKKLIAKPYSGRMIHVVGQQLDIKVTPEHRMFTARRKSGSGWHGFAIEQAHETVGVARRYKVAALGVETPGVALPCSPELIGFFVGDGFQTGNQLQFNLRRPRKIAYLRRIYPGCRQLKSGGLVVDDGPLAIWFRQNCYQADGQKCLPPDVLYYSAKQVAGLLNGLKNSDGSVKRSTWVYDSTSARLIDQLQALAALNGFAMTRGKKAHSGNPKHKPHWRLNVSRRIDPEVSALGQGRSRTYSTGEEDYHGSVYCASVSTGLLIVRRCGKVVISGNSPFEHAARADEWADTSNFGAKSGWQQYRKMIPGEDGEMENLFKIYKGWPSWIAHEDQFTCPTCLGMFRDSETATVHANECPTRVI